MRGNPELFHRVKSIEKILSFLTDPLTTNNAIYHDLLTLNYNSLSLL